MASNINPSLTPVNSLDNFRFWCQKVLPLVYDDSLSYYEVLGKMVVQLNDVIDNVNADTENVLTLKDAFLELQTYVNNFFDDIDQLASYAERAEAAQTAANTSAVNAATSASNASASSLAAMDARDTAVTAKQAAETSANTASTAATNANTKANEAAQSAITAQTAQASASQSATLAATDRSAAQTAANTATTKANEASTSASNAETSAENASQSEANAEELVNNIQENLDNIQHNTQDISDLKESLDEVKEITVTEESETVTENIFPSLTWTDDKYMGTNGTVYSGTGYRYSNKISVSEGDSFAFANPNFGFGYITAFNGDTAVSDSGQQGGKTYTVPSGINGLVITENMSRGDAAINWTHQNVTYKNAMEDRMESAEAEIETIQESIEAVNYTDDVSVDTVPTFTTGAIDQNGSVYTSSSYAEFQYSQKINAVNGATIVCLDAAGNQVKMRWVCAYKNNTAVPASGTNADVYSFTLSGDIDSVVVTCRIASAAVIVRVTTPTEKTAYFANAKPIPMGYMTESGSLADGEILYLPKTNVKNDNVLIFNANISTFDSIKIGKQSNTYVIVDDTNITLHNTGNPDTYTLPHGLTIGSNITVMIQTENSLDASLIRVSSDGVTYDYTTPKLRFAMDDGTPYAISIGSSLTDCRFSWTSKNVNAPIWIFGDSYISYWDTNWTYFLLEDGYKKSYMMNGLAGQASESAYNSLLNLINITVPKMIVWCLGMNDPDDGAVNASWYKYYLKLIELSKKYGFELVLYTVPTTPIMDNTYKDTIIRGSGYRYIEADKAVRIDASGNWVTGALANDNVHPTAIGGNILYNRILADLPEMMCNY